LRGSEGIAQAGVAWDGHYRDILSKSLGSNNTLNRAKAAFYALCELKAPHQVAKIRGKTVVQMVGREVVDDYAAEDARQESEAAEAEVEVSG